MSILFDANILIHAANAASPVHAHAKRLRDQAVDGVIDACLAPQVLWEFYAVVTSPKRVDHPLAFGEAVREIQTYLKADRLALLIPRQTTTLRTVELARQRRSAGRRIFDLYLAATMLDHGVRTIYTENIDDFRGIHDIEAVNPFTTTAPAIGKTTTH